MRTHLLAGIMFVCAWNAAADQLAWVGRRDAVTAAESINQQVAQRRRLGETFHMVSYCSRCDDERVEVWEVSKVVAAAIPDGDYFELQVFGRCVLRSAKALREGEYKEPIVYVRPPAKDRDWFLREVDMAYVYVPSEDGFLCLGKALHLDCEIRVERIRLPRGILATVGAAPVPK